MVSDQEIASCVESLLRSSAASGDGATAADASLSAVLEQAEAELGVDLSHKASFIRDQMDLFFGPRLQPPSKPPPLPAAATAPAPPPPQPQVALPHPPPPLPAIPGSGATALQPHLIFQAVPQLAGTSAVGVGAVAAVPGPTAAAVPPAVPAMAFYPPPPLAFRYTSAMSLAAGGPGGGAASFQQQNQQLPPAGPGAIVVATGVQAGEPKESATKRKRGGPGGLNKVCAISPELQNIVGETVMSRTEIVKQLWAYIRKNNLQDPEDKRKIICNDELRVLFGTDTTDMFKMNKLLAKHITPIEDQVREVKKFKAPITVPQTRPHIAQPSVVISDALAKFFETEGTVTQDDALKYLWDYIKSNQLEDVMSSSILCDTKLQELFGCESIRVSELSKLLARHFIKKT